MKRLILSVVMAAASLCTAENAAADERKTPSYLAFNAAAGSVLKTNDFVKGDYAIPRYNSFALKYVRAAKGDTWEDIAYGMPYYGVGIYIANFQRDDDLGQPVSVYILSGATIRQFSRRLALGWEWNLGASTGWKSYDPFDNPENVALGSKVNIHIAANLNVKWYVSRRVDLRFGVGVTHFSNGANKMPNSGINMVDGFVELSYNFNRDRRGDNYDVIMPPAIQRKHIEYDILVNISSRQVRADTTETGLPSQYVNEKFNVFGLSGAMLYAPNYRYRYGASVDVLYDESSGARIWREQHPADMKYYERVKLGSFGERFSIGLSAKGEVVFPHYSIFANMGYQLLHGNERDRRLYQILGIKIYLKDNFFGTFGIRATRFSKAQYIYWSLGYTLGKNKY